MVREGGGKSAFGLTAARGHRQVGRRRMPVLPPTGGGAFLEFLEGKALPALAILKGRAKADPDYVHPSEGTERL
jgi:hypothetical protein